MRDFFLVCLCRNIDCEVMNSGSNFIPNGMVSSETPFVVKVLDPKRWSKAEGRTRDLLKHIQPNHTTETCRNAVVSYLRSLIMNSVPCQVFFHIFSFLHLSICFISIN